MTPIPDQFRNPSQKSRNSIFSPKHARNNSEFFNRLHPLCADHLKRGQYVQATLVDHIQPHRGDMALFWDSRNWQSLCKLCHDSYKQRLEKSGVVAGCDLAGNPTDPAHHWNR